MEFVRAVPTGAGWVGASRGGALVDFVELLQRSRNDRGRRPGRWGRRTRYDNRSRRTNPPLRSRNPGPTRRERVAELALEGQRRRQRLRVPEPSLAILCSGSAVSTTSSDFRPRRCLRSTLGMPAASIGARIAVEIAEARERRRRTAASSWPVRRCRPRNHRRVERGVGPCPDKILSTPASPALVGL